MHYKAFVSVTSFQLIVLYLAPEKYDTANSEALGMSDENVNRNAVEAANQEREYRTLWRHHHHHHRLPGPPRRPVPVRRPSQDPTVPQKDVITDSEGFGIGDS